MISENEAKLKVLNTVIVNKDAEYVQMMCDICRGNPYINIVKTFSEYREALPFIECHDVDFVILDMDIPVIFYEELTDVLIRHIRRMVVYLSSSAEIPTGMRPRARGVYDDIIPMYTEAFDIHNMIFRALTLHEKKRREVLRIQTFDRFDVFSGDEVILFQNAKAKELFALCVDHIGGEVTMEEAIDKLWPNRPYDERVKKLYRKAVFCLKNTLEDYTYFEVFQNSRGKCNILVEGLKCDFFEYIKELKEGTADLSKLDRYMQEYSWAEYTIGKLHFLYKSDKEEDI